MARLGAEAEALGVQGTPWVTIAGRRYELPSFVLLDEDVADELAWQAGGGRWGP